MAEEATTATAAMRFDLEKNRLEHRDRAVAMSIGLEMTEAYFKPDAIEDMRDVREQISRAAEHAAYQAIQKERELHAGDMAALRQWSEVQWAEAMLRPPPPIVVRDSDTRPKDGDAKLGSTRE